LRQEEVHTNTIGRIGKRTVYFLALIVLFNGVTQMKIGHRYANRSDSDFFKALASLQLEIEGSDGMSILRITEDHELWPAVRELGERYCPIHQTFNEFTKAEIRRAEWLMLGSTGHFGYPQPEDGFGYLEATYDTTHYCRRCGIGAVQKAPFRFRAEPKAAHSQFMQLN